MGSIGKMQTQVAAEQVQGILGQGDAALYGLRVEIKSLRIDYLSQAQKVRHRMCAVVYFFIKQRTLFM